MSENYKEAKNRRVYNIDFDGVLTTGEYTANPTANIEVIQYVRKIYYNGHIIIVWTARWWEDACFMVAWLIKNKVPFHGIMMGKGGSDVYIDDKAIDNKNFLED